MRQIYKEISMMKTRNHSFGLLNAQYRKVLKKCVFLNAMAACFFALNLNEAKADLIPITNNEWDNGNSYTADSGDQLRIEGNYNTANTLDKSYISQVNGGRVSITGNVGESTVVSKKVVSVSTVPGTVSGGFIKSEGSLSAASTGSNISLVNAVIENSGIDAKTDDTSGNYVIQGGVIAAVNADTEDNNQYFNINASDNVQINENFIKVTDTNQTAGSVIHVKGGAFYNSSSLRISGSESGGNYSSQLFGNSTVIDSSATTAEAERKAFGGAVYNDGKLEISGTKITENHAEADIALGGAIYNDGKADNASFSVDGSLIIGNYIKAGKEAYGGAVYNQSKDGKTSTINKTSLTYNYIEADNADIALGGAVYNEGSANSVSQITISSGGGNIYIANNYISAGENTISRGGALYNAANGLFTVDAAGGSIAFEKNTAKEGGAIYNAADNTGAGSVKSAFQISTGNGSISFTQNNAAAGGAVYNAANSYMNIASDTTSENSGVSFSGNTAEASGGAIYNAENGTIKIVSKVSFDSNAAADAGGAVYNGENSSISIDLDSSASLAFSSNTANSGGALYNDGGRISIANNGASDISFSGNTATAGGGAIYNKSGTIDINSAGGSLVFENNTAQTGGAIYNGENGVIKITMSADKNIDFVTAGDNIYNDGMLSIFGSSATTAEGEAVSTNMNLNGLLSGSGSLYASNMVLNMTDSQIESSQQLNFINSVINMDATSVLNVNPDDNMSGASITTVQGAIINYVASAENTDGTVAGALNNGGTLNAQDGIISKITIGNLINNGGYIYLDADKDKQISDILNITDSVSGTVNLKMSNMDNVNGLGTKILFAQTNAEQSTDDYEFKFDFDSSIFLPEIENQVNSGVRDWYLNYNGQVRREVLNDIILPRAMVEQTRDIRVDTSHNDNSPRIRYEYGYRNTLRKVDDKHRKISLWANPVYRHASMSTVTDSTASIWGVDFGLNMNVAPDSKTGLLVSYRKGSYDKDGTNGDFYSRRSGDIDISSTLVGLYYSKYFSRFYVNGMAYGGEQKARLTAHEDTEAFSSTKALQAGAKLEAGYEAPVTSKLTVTPLLSAAYDYIKIDDSTDNLGKTVSYDDIHDIELEGGFKFDYKFNNDHQLPTNGYLKTTVVQLLENGGKAQVRDVEFDKTLENETAGRVEIGGEAALLKNFVVGGFGNYTFGSGYSGFAVGGNVRYTW